MIMFVRHRSGPFYLGFEIAHWKFLRQGGDEFAVAGFDAGDVVVDDCGELLWRLRAMYGLKNARGTRMLTIGGLCAYSNQAQENGPRVARELWDYEFIDVSDEEFARLLGEARSSRPVVKQVEQQTAALLKELLAERRLGPCSAEKLFVNSRSESLTRFGVRTSSAPMSRLQPKSVLRLRARESTHTACGTAQQSACSQQG